MVENKGSNPMNKWDDLGGFPIIFGNTQVVFMVFCEVVNSLHCAATSIDWKTPR